MMAQPRALLSRVHRLDRDRPAAVHCRPVGCCGGHGNVLRAAQQAESPPGLRGSAADWLRMAVGSDN